MGEVAGAGELMRDHHPPRVHDELAGLGRAQRSELRVDPVEPHVRLRGQPELLRLAGDERGWTVVCGNAAVMASSNPVRPSTQAMRMSVTPRLRRSAVTLRQKAAPSPVGPSEALGTQMPRTCLSPSVSIPTAR
jgi:hypothetical protein